MDFANSYSNAVAVAVSKIRLYIEKGQRETGASGRAIEAETEAHPFGFRSPFCLAIVVLFE